MDTFTFTHTHTHTLQDIILQECKLFLLHVFHFYFTLNDPSVNSNSRFRTSAVLVLLVT